MAVFCTWLWKAFSQHQVGNFSHSWCKWNYETALTMPVYQPLWVRVTQERNLQWVGMVKVVNVLRKTESSPVCNLGAQQENWNYRTSKSSMSWNHLYNGCVFGKRSEAKPLFMSNWATDNRAHSALEGNLFHEQQFLCSCWLQIPLLSIASWSSTATGYQGRTSWTELGMSLPRENTNPHTEWVGHMYVCCDIYHHTYCPYYSSGTDVNTNATWHHCKMSCLELRCSAL